MFSSLFRFADHALVSAAAGMQLFEDGFGDRAELEALVRAIDDRSLASHDVSIDVALSSRVEAHSGHSSRAGRFRSPSADALPAESRTALIELLTPSRPTGALAILLAATGEEGFWLRRRFSGPLLERGIATLSLENAYYGARRPHGQRASLLRTVRDQFAMNVATVQEARALATWAKASGYEQICLTGFSQGGSMASFAAALTPFALATAPRGTGDGAAAIFTNAALSRRIAWQRLALELGGEAAARRYFNDCLAPVKISRFAPPLAVHAAILLGARGDGFIPQVEVQALHRHWLGSELRWISSSHVMAAAFHRSAHHSAIVDALGRLG